MLSSTRKHVLLFVAAGGVGLPLAYFFARPFDFWLLAGLYALTVILWFGLALVHLAKTLRFGAPMTLDEIRKEADPVRMAKLLRYHLGWSPGKIASELNRWGVRNHGLPWRENDVRRAVKRIGRLF
jgi:hypothetical protein